MARTGITALDENDMEFWSFAELVNLYGVLSRAQGNANILSLDPRYDTAAYHSMAVDFMTEAIFVQQVMFARMFENGGRPDMLMNTASVQISIIA